VSAAEDYDTARASWDFPAFAKDFPRQDELDALVVSFARGDYGTVRKAAPKLAASAEDEAVKRAAGELYKATQPDPGARLLVIFAAALLVFLTIWWVGHNGPGPERSAPQPVPTVEHIK
jgi:hypothetical protein